MSFSADDAMPAEREGPWKAAALLGSLGLVLEVRRTAWLCDDSYIDLRMAWNVIHGFDALRFDGGLLTDLQFAFGGVKADGCD